MLMSVLTPAVAAQAVAEGVGGSVQGSTLTGAAAPLGAVPPQGGEEVSAWLASTIAAHTAAFLPPAFLGAAQREALAMSLGVSAATFAAMDAINLAGVAL